MQFFELHLPFLKSEYLIIFRQLFLPGKFVVETYQQVIYAVLILASISLFSACLDFTPTLCIIT